MKNNLKYMIVVVLGIMLLISLGCGKKVVKSEAPNLIVGKWFWVESMGGIGGMRLTPESEGYTKTYVFNPDSTFLSYKNDTLVMMAKYRITRKLVWDRYMADVLQIEEQIEQIIEFQGNDTLGLEDHMVDGFEHLFFRVKGE